MAFTRRPQTEVGTAQELFYMHQGIRAAQLRTGSIEVALFQDGQPPLVGFSTLLNLARERHAARSTLMLTSYVLGGGIDTQVSFWYPGSIDEPAEIEEKTIDPELVVRMASAGIDLLSGYVSLSPDERKDLSYIPYGNEKVFDHLDPSALASSPTLIAARALLLVEPDF